MSSTVSVAIASTFTADPLESTVAYWIQRTGSSSQISFAPYGQVFQSLLDPRGALRGNREGINVLLVRRSDLAASASDLGRVTEDLRRALESSIAASGAPHIVIVCPAPGDDAAVIDEAFARELLSVAGTDVIAPASVATLYPVARVFDPFAEGQGQIPYTEEYFAALGTMIARRMRVARTTPKKVILLDCDDTLWGGICGEVGSGGVVLEPSRLAFQERLLALRDQGALLAVVSRNNEQDALAVFDERPEMRIRREHLTTYRINWSPKSQNILDIARELELSVDSFVFLDDDAFVCAEAADVCSGLTAVQVPSDPDALPGFVDHLWALDRGRVTDEDRRRATAYREQSERERVRRTMTHADFLASLDLVIELTPMESADLARVSQLTARTNQFNATTRRRSEAELLALRAGDQEILTVRVRDRFGDYGLTGVVIGGPRASEDASSDYVLDTFLLSCRVLGRGVEHAVIRSLAESAQRRRCNTLTVPFVRSAKNSPYATFFESLPCAARREDAEMSVAVVDTTVARALQPRATDVTSASASPSASGGMRAPAAAPAVDAFDFGSVALGLQRVDDILRAVRAHGREHRAAYRREIAPGAAEQNTTVTTIVRLFGELLDAPAVTASDDLFELGGDSVLALRILARVHELYSVEIPLHDFFQWDAHTPAAVARAVEERRVRDGRGAMVANDKLAGTVAAIWREVLTLDEVTASSDLFEVGGDSVAALRILARLHEQLGIEVRLQDFFQWETHTLSRMVDEVRRVLPPTVAPADTESPLRAARIASVGRDGPLPLSFAEARLWFVDQLDRDSPDRRSAQHLSLGVRLRGRLDHEALARAVDELSIRHESLRTRFAHRGGTPFRIIDPPQPSAIRVARHRVEPSLVEDREQAAQRWARAQRSVPFDLENGPALRVSTLEIDDGDNLLQLDMHHALSDGWSLQLILDDLAAYYRAARGRELALAPLSIQYADYAVWQREQLRGPALETLLAYWTHELDGAPTVIELPPDRPRATVQSNRAGRAIAKLEPGTSARLVELARTESASLFMAILTACGVVLSRASGQSDVVIGTPVSQRNAPELTAITGMFINTLPLRVRVPEGASFRSLLREVRRMTLQGFAHQELPFEILVERLQPTRDLQVTPLFQVALVSFNFPRAELDMPGLTRVDWVSEQSAATYDLTFLLDETPGGIVLTAIFRDELFETARIEAWLGQIRTLVERAVDAPDASLLELDLLGAAERERLTRMLNDTQVTHPAAMCVHEMLDAHIRERGTAPAVEHRGRTLTYAELDAHAAALTTALEERGAGPGMFIAVALPRSLEMVVAQLAVLRSGAAFVSLDPTHPPERLAQMVAECDARIFLTSDDASALEQHLATTVSTLFVQLAAVAPVTGGRSREAKRAAVGLGEVAYAILTSGSTGTPKAVVVEHRSLTNLVRWALREHPLIAGEIAAQTAGPSFDPSVWEIWTYLAAGAHMILVDEELRLSPRALTRFLIARKVTRVQLPTPLAEACLAEDWSGSSLRTMFVGGDRLLPRASLPPFRLVNAYGPAECTVIATTAEITADNMAAPPIGRPIDNTRVYVVDDHLQLVPTGVAGELLIAGDGVARGYTRADLTRERFIADPFAPGGRAYRTGDWVRWTSAGELEFIGRRDDQVKIRGQRIELGEIEAVLRRHPQIADARVLAHGAPEKSLFAYLIRRAEADAPSLAELRTFVEGALPMAMVPSGFSLLDEWPLTTNGKIDLRALPLPTRASSAAGEGVALSRTETAIAAIWRDVLRVEQVTREDDFFAIGGHSLVAMQVVARIERDLGVELPVRVLFEARTLSGVARAVDHAHGVTAELTLPQRREELPLTRVDRDGELPVSFTEARLWFLDRLEPGSAAYNLTLSLRLRGALDEAALARAVEVLVARHEAIRTRFGERDGHPYRIIDPAPAIALTVERAALGDDTDIAALRWAREQAARPFDLAIGPLFRAQLLAVAPDDYALMIVMHHIVSDGWSMQRLNEELATLYRSFAGATGLDLAPLAVQYADYAVWQRARLTESALEQHVAYWRKHLDGAPVAIELPTDRLRPAEQSHEGASVEITLSRSESERLLELARREGVSLFMAMLAAYATVLSRLSGQSDVVVGAPIAQRNHPALEHIVGMFMNTLPLRVPVDSAQSFRTLLAEVQRLTLDAYAHQELPFEVLVEKLQPPRDLGRTPVFQVMLVALNYPRSPAELPGIGRTPLFTDEPLSKVDLTVYVDERPDGVALRAVYRSDLFDRVRVEELLEQVRVFLRAAVGAPDAPLATHALVTARARAHLPDPLEPLDATWHGSVAEVTSRAASRQPARAAVVDGCESWTYGELDARANQLARRLRSAGCRRGDRVAIFAHRAAALAVAVLGALRAGCAFVILDPAYPEGQLAARVEVAAPRVLLRLAGAPELPAEVLAALAEIEGEVVDLPTLADAERVFAGTELTPPSIAIRQNDLAYITFTSGSTGKPKGVRGRHGPLSHFHPWRVEHFSLSSEDRFCLVSGLSHDPLHRDLFTPLQLGATLIVPDAEDMTVPGRLSQWMRRHGITVAHLTPSLAQLLTDTADEDLRLPDLRRVFLVGEALTGRDVARLRRLAPNVQVVNYYGATETQQALAYHVVGDVALEATVPLGKGTRDVQLLVIAAGGTLAGVGELGEIVFRSPHLAAGYVGDEQGTSDKFIAHPLTGARDERAYRTGDLGRYRPDGEVEFAGRSDLQVKIRGFRVELQEIEAVLGSHPEVSSAVVVARDVPPRGTLLIAFVVARAGAATAKNWSETLRAFVGARLPEYMIPTAFVPIASVPRTPNAKVDRRALPSPDLERGSERVPPSTPTEHAVARIVGALLRIEEVGITEGFFALGGHSLLAMQLVSRVQRELGCSIPVRAVFETADLRGLAELIDETGRPSNESSEQSGRPPIMRRDPADETGRASFNEIHLFSFEKRIPGNTAWVMCKAAELRGLRSVEPLRAAWEALIHRHSVLRTRFVERDGEVVRLIEPKQRIELPVFSVEPGTDVAAVAEQGVRREMLFDLERGPLAKAALHAIGPDDYVLVMVFHHIVTDAASDAALWTELQDLWRAAARGELEAVRDSDIGPSYADFAEWQHELHARGHFDADLAYWRARIEAARPAPLPFGAEARITAAPKSLAAELLSPELSTAIHALQRGGLTLHPLLQAALSAVIWSYSGQRDVSIVSPLTVQRFSGDGLDRTVGFFLNHVLVSAELDPTTSFREHALRCRDALQDAQAHGQAPTALVLGNDPLQHPLSRIVLNVIGFAPKREVDEPIDGCTVRPMPVDPPVSAKFPLAMMARPVGERIFMFVAADAATYDQQQVAAVLADVRTALGALLARADEPVEQALRRIRLACRDGLS